MGELGLRPDWRGWIWLRRGALSLLLLLVAWATVRTHTAGEMDAGEIPWLVGLGVVMAGFIWCRRPAMWAVLFFLLFLGMEIWLGGGLESVATLAAYGVLVDVNSRRPVWLGLGALVALVGLGFILNDVRIALASSVYFCLLALFGQFIRAAFDGARAQREAAELRRVREQMELMQAVHDSGSARLSQVLLIARGLRETAELPPGVRAEVDTLIDVAAAGADELRAAIRRGPAPAAGATVLALEWSRSLRVLGASGFSLVEVGLPDTSVVPAAVQAEAARCIREATTNIGRHGSAGGQVAAHLALDSDWLRMTWTNESDGLYAARVGAAGSPLGLAGLSQRVAALGGDAAFGATDHGYRLVVSLPIRLADVASGQPLVRRGGAEAT